MNAFIFASLIIYFLFDFFDGRRPSDEREELIRLKALVFSHKATMFALCILSALFWWNNSLDVRIAILVLVFSALYTEMLGKLVFRRRL